MGIGTSIFLLAAGAVLSFGIQDSFSGVDLTMIGYILMGAGALGLILFLTVFGRRQHTIAKTTETRDQAGNRVVQSEVDGGNPPAAY